MKIKCGKKCWWYCAKLVFRASSTQKPTSKKKIWSAPKWRLGDTPYYNQMYIRVVVLGTNERHVLMPKNPPFSLLAICLMGMNQGTIFALLPWLSLQLVTACNPWEVKTKPLDELPQIERRFSHMEDEQCFKVSRSPTKQVWFLLTKRLFPRILKT